MHSLLPYMKSKIWADKSKVVPNNFAVMNNLFDLRKKNLKYTLTFLSLISWSITIVDNLELLNIEYLQSALFCKRQVIPWLAMIYTYSPKEERKNKPEFPLHGFIYGLG